MNFLCPAVVSIWLKTRRGYRNGMGYGRPRTQRRTRTRRQTQIRSLLAFEIFKREHIRVLPLLGPTFHLSEVKAFDTVACLLAMFEKKKSHTMRLLARRVDYSCPTHFFLSECFIYITPTLFQVDQIAPPPLTNIPVSSASQGSDILRAEGQFDSSLNRLQCHPRTRLSRL